MFMSVGCLFSIKPLCLEALVVGPRCHFPLRRRATGGHPHRGVRPGSYCSPRHPTHLRPSFLEFHGIL
jgi:hypothetical protein